MGASSRGFLLIADITGYTRFLQGSELDHARGVLERLFGALLEGLKSPFTLSNVQGDAILAHAPAAAVPAGDQVLDTVDALYCGFAGALEDMIRNTTCRCAACRNIAGLDLKLFLHFGEYAEQTIAGRQELSGPEVIRIHRLLKNNITAATGVRAYAAFTDAAASAIGITAYFAEARPHAESDAQFGETSLRIVDMRPVWEARKTQRLDVVGENEPRWIPDLVKDVPAPPDRVWHYLTHPDQRAGWVPDVARFMRSKTRDGRAGVGTVDHCAHGSGQVMQFTIVDWRPGQHVTYHLAMPMAGWIKYTIFLAPSASGTRISVRIARPAAPTALRRWLLRRMLRKMVAGVEGMWRVSLDNLVALAERHAAGMPSAAPAASVPVPSPRVFVEASLAAAAAPSRI